MTLLNVLKEFEACKGNIDWCANNFLSQRALKQVIVFYKLFINRTCDVNY